MSDYTVQIEELIERSTSVILEGVAKDGLVALRRVLSEAGFNESEYLKNYEVYSHVEGDAVMFEILLSIDAFDPESYKEMGRRTVVQTTEKSNKKTYGFSPSGEVARYDDNRSLIDKREIVKSTKDARKSTLNKAVGAPTKLNPALDKRIDSDIRMTAHSVAADSPRDVRIDRDGKLSIGFEKRITENEETGTFHYPEAKFGGIVKQFYTKLHVIFEKKFSLELARIVEKYQDD